ncbi:rhamnan synthesis F family protein [Pseudoalteromonas sp. YIC-656]|uniref:rhamnan synthesis F family protein n=1 Tax=Pseudoalteromonas pernae TaxID=3118054 RepID=UPI003242879B
MFKNLFKRTYKKELSEIRSYEIDWSEFYSTNNVESSLEPEEYFVLNVQKRSLIVPNVLDVEFYLSRYADVQFEQVNPLIHYMRYGRFENRKAFPDKKKVIPKLSKAQIEHDFSVIAQQNINWESYIELHALSSENEAIAHYATYWPVLLPVIDDVIDSKFYVDKYPDIWERGDNPLVHYLTHGKEEGRSAFQQEQNSGGKESIDLKEEPISVAVKLEPQSPVCELATKLASLSVDWRKFSKVNNLKGDCHEPIQYVVENHEKMMLTIPGFFDSKLYLELYPDIANAPISPLRHFLFHGKAEGRIGYFNIKKHFELGAHTFDKEKELYVVVSHESSATGAPLVGFNLSQQLAKQANVVNIVLRKSKLQPAFAKECVASISDLHVQSPVLAKKALEFIAQEFKGIDGIICNSVETAYVLHAANQLDIPSVSLVHEFSEYTRPVGKITNTVFHADRVVVPAQVIKDSMCRELKSFRGVKVVPNNIAIQPQGRLPFIPEGHGKLDSIETLKAKLGLDTSDEPHVLIGAGYVQIRKGVDLFIAAAKRIKELADKPCKFVWVGEGYEPNKDLHYANWVQTQITLNGLEDDVVFLGHQRNLDNIMTLADVFCMTSRLDPFPNVVIDALDADVHVACFEQSTGCAQFLKDHDANATIADYLNIEAYAQGVGAYLNTGNRWEGKNKEIVTNHLNFERYTEVAIEQLMSAMEFRKRVSQCIALIKEDNTFDAAFYDPALTPEEAIKEYVQLGLKGIHLYNPKPGFCERKWLARANNPYQSGLAESLPLGEDTTHDVYTVNTNTKLSAIDFKYAVHLHLFYPDLAQEFARYLSALPSGFDVYITHLSDADTESIKLAFESCGADNVHLVIVENKGRDVAPFIDVLKPHIDADAYAVVGHFHSKKSLEVGGDMGDRWRRFLLDTLIGDKQQAAQVLAQFNDSEIGLVFAEDRHCVDSGENISFIETLYEKMDMSADPNCYLFPLGTMFWARSDAIKPLFSLPQELYTPDEPLPYDGSYLHAIERALLPLSESQGYLARSIYLTNRVW